MAEESILFGLMILLEVNEDKHALVAGHARSLVETHEWANMVFSRTGGTEDEGNRIRMLAATILIKTQEILQSYQEALKEHQSIF